MGVVPLKDDSDFRKHNIKAVDTASEELRLFVSEVEAIASQGSDLNRDRQDMYTVAKSKGYDVKALRRLISDRKRDAAELEEERLAVVQYRDLLL